MRPSPRCHRTVAAIANDPAFHLRMSLKPGDLEIIHNPSTLHSRTRVVDAEVTGRPGAARAQRSRVCRLLVAC